MRKSSDAVMQFILAEIEAGREFPQRKMIAEHMGWKRPESADDAMRTLVADGHLAVEHRPKQGRKPYVYSLRGKAEGGI